MRLDSYEADRARLNFDTGMLICLTYNVSERWLATGKGKMIPRSAVPLSALAAPLDAPFSLIYDNLIAKAAETPGQGGPVLVESIPDAAKRAKETLRRALELWERERISDQDWPDFVELLLTCAAEFSNSKWQVLLQLCGKAYTRSLRAHPGSIPSRKLARLDLFGQALSEQFALIPTEHPPHKPS